jgi:hypothetical protein
VQEVLERIVDAPDDAWVPEFRRKYGLELCLTAATESA